MKQYKSRTVSRKNIMGLEVSVQSPQYKCIAGTPELTCDKQGSVDTYIEIPDKLAVNLPYLTRQLSRDIWSNYQYGGSDK